jgi:hypothetical protein
MFLRNVGYLSTDYMALYRRRCNSSSWLVLGTFGRSGEVLVTLCLGLKMCRIFWRPLESGIRLMRKDFSYKVTKKNILKIMFRLTKRLRNEAVIKVVTKRCYRLFYYPLFSLKIS